MNLIEYESPHHQVLNQNLDFGETRAAESA